MKNCLYKKVLEVIQIKKLSYTKITNPCEQTRTPLLPSEQTYLVVTVAVVRPTAVCRTGFLSSAVLAVLLESHALLPQDKVEYDLPCLLHADLWQQLTVADVKVNGCQQYSAAEKVSLSLLHRLRNFVAQHRPMRVVEEPEAILLAVEVPWGNISIL